LKGYTIPFKDRKVDIEPSSSPDSPLKESNRPNFNFNSLRQIIFQPAQAFAGVVAQPKQAWLTPIFLVLVLIVIAALASTQGANRSALASSTSRSTSLQATAQTTKTTTGSSKSSGSSSSSSSSQGGFAGVPGGGGGNVVIFQGGPGGAPPDMAGGFPMDIGGGGMVGGGTTTNSGGSSATSATSQNIWLTMLSPAVTFLLSWLVLGVLTNLLALGFGGHGKAGMAMNIAAWSTIPIGVRNLMQIFYYLASGNTIAAAGLSGFAPAANGDNWLVLLRQVLAHVDLYLFWQIGLLAVGVAVWGGLARKKSWTVAILGIVLVLALQALLGLGLEALGGVNLNIGTLLRLR
jgi:hypothetical protein